MRDRGRLTGTRGGQKGIRRFRQRSGRWCQGSDGCRHRRRRRNGRRRNNRSRRRRGSRFWSWLAEIRKRKGWRFVRRSRRCIHHPGRGILSGRRGSKAGKIGFVKRPTRPRARRRFLGWGLGNWRRLRSRSRWSGCRGGDHQVGAAQGTGDDDACLFDSQSSVATGAENFQRHGNSGSSASGPTPVGD